jgi:hypothetical protein
MLVASLVGAALLAAAPATGADETIAIDLARTPARAMGAIRAFRADDAAHARFDVHLVGSMLQPPNKIGEVT